MSDRNELTNELINSYQHMIRRFKKEIHNILGNEMNSSKFIILKALFDRGPLRASALSQEFGVSASHITHVTDRLVQKGWVNRQRSHSDKRVVKLQITTEGKERYQKIAEKRNLFLQKKFGSLTTEELRHLLHLVQKMDIIQPVELIKEQGKLMG